MNARFALSALLTLTCLVAFAAGAPWYRWKNTADSTTLCAQNSPGETWVIEQGPYMESTCRKPGTPQ